MARLRLKTLTLKKAFTQAHLTAFWHNTSCPTPFVALWQLHAHNHHHNRPSVYVAVSQNHVGLLLSYFIEKKPWLQLTDLQAHLIQRQDYLWQQNCLECFVALSDKTYLEINVSPQGAYNIYRFNDYRTPNQMPPIQDKKATLSLPTVNVAKCFSQLAGWHSRHVAVKLVNDFNLNKHHHPHHIGKIHPCVILYQNEQPIFYACQHANPPDFHDKRYWQTWQINQN